MKKQILSLFLCLCMLVGMLPLSVLAKTDDTILLDISEGSIVIENGTNEDTFKLTHGSNTTDNIDPSTIFEISGTTTSNTITVSANQIEDETPLPVNIILNGVNIDVSGINYACAFNITSSAGAVNITLAEGSINTLKSGKDCAGLQKSNNTSSSSGEKAGNDVLLTIGGTGTLNATGYEYCAGIGGKIGDSCNYLTISGGIINANGGGYGGAGIGGGFTGGASNITIRGGTITANSNGGAGIGSGNHANASNIFISGGTVVANGSSGGAGIGAGRSVAANLYGDCSGIYISGGMITATGGAEGSGIGGGKGGDCNGVFISGGTIVANGGSGGDGIGSGAPLFTPPFPGDEFGTGDFTYGITENIVITGGNLKAISFGVTPKNGSDDSAVNVYKVTFTVPGATDGTLVESLSIGGYNTTGIKTLDTNKVYLYLPSNSEDTSTLAVYNSAYYTAMVKSDGSAVFSINSPYISELAVDEVSPGQKLNLTTPPVNSQGYTITSQGWQIKKSGGNYENFDPSATVLDLTFNNALLRYYVTYTDGGKKTVYSNEVTVTVGKAAGSVTNISDISKIYDGSAVSDPTYTSDSTGTATFEYKVKDADDSTYTTTKPSTVGNYTVRVSVAEDDIYTAASATKDFAITFLTSPVNPFTLSSAANSAGWHNSDVTITPESGYTLSTSLNGTYSASLTVSATVSDYTVYLKNAQGQMTDANTVGDIKIDKDAPTNLSVEYGKDTAFRRFLNTITFGLFFKERITVYLFASDNNSRMKEFKYTLNGTEHTIAAGGGMVTFYIDPQFIGNISGVKAIDNADNVSDEIATEYFAIDSESPAAPTVDFGGRPTNAWINQDMTITVSGCSATSGIAKYQYTNDGGVTWIDMTTTEADEATLTTPYNAKKASLLLNYEVNALTFSFRAVSNAGNIGEASEGKVVKIDKFRPVVTVNGNRNDYRQSDTINIAVDVGISGIMYFSVKKDNGDWISIIDNYQDGYTVTENGTYHFSICSKAGITTGAIISYQYLDSAKPVISIDTNGYTEGVWQNNGNVTLNVSNATANLGTTVIQYKVGNGPWSNYIAPIVISRDTNGTVPHTFRATSASGVVSDEKSITVKRDTTIPDGDIIIKENSVKKFINTISFGLFFKENIDVTISSTDAASGVESVKYYRSDKILTQDELNAVSTWEDYNGTITETAADTQKFVYYVKITDNAGNVNLFGSDGVTFDTTAPVITGIEDGKAYKPNTEVTVSDATDVTVTLNGNSTTLQDDKFSLTGQTGSVTVEVIDAAGNKTTLTITVNEEGLLIDTENNPDGSVTVTKTNNDGKVVEILVTYSDGSTDQTLNNIDGTSVETKKDSSGNVTETTVTQADGSSIKTENKSDGSTVETKKDSSGAITETTTTAADGSSIKTENKSDGSVVETNMDSSGKVTETTITQVDGSSVKTENKPDGSVVETKKDNTGNITETTVTQPDGSSVKTENKPDGSTVVTKTDADGKSSEITSIAADGSKIVTVYNADGTTTVTRYDPDGKVINDKDTDNSTVPHTGDNSNMQLWIALLFISGGVLTVFGVKRRKRKTVR